MLQRTFSRIQPLLPNEHILVSTGQEYAAPVLEQLPDLPPENVIVELEGRGTAPCIGLSAIHLERRNPDEIMVTLHADAYIKDEQEFRQILLAAVEAARRDHLVTIGITPDYPETGFGYIQRGQVAERIQERAVYAVKRFTEKPDPDTAQHFYESGEYYWNSGMFAWKLSRIMSEMERCQPELASQLRQIQGALDTPQEAEATRHVWSQIANQSIDVGIMEKARDVVVIPAQIGWSDIGNWASLAELIQTSPQENTVAGKGQLLAVDTRGCFVYSPNRLVATIGLEDMVIVDTGDAILICPKDRAQDVKRVVDRLGQMGLDQYL